ncbi:MAG: hypothetical protein K1X57_02580 [Gemmataceae bacterium]|nr:hypothetical protein [Gemmataceae bacterium]
MTIERKHPIRQLRLTNHATILRVNAKEIYAVATGMPRARRSSVKVGWPVGFA